MLRVVVLSIICMGIGAIVYWFRLRPSPLESVHFHAGFVVYIDGVKQDYRDYKYMNFTPCAEHGTKKSSQEEQVEKAHLHDGVGDVVHVHREGGTWNDLFQNSNITLPLDKGVVIFRESKNSSKTLNEKIVPDESVIIVIGSPVDISSGMFVSQARIQEIESKSELCGKGG